MSSTKDLDLFRHACACCLHDLIGKYGPCQYMNDEKLRTSRMGWLDPGCKRRWLACLLVLAWMDENRAFLQESGPSSGDARCTAKNPWRVHGTSRRGSRARQPISICVRSGWMQTCKCVTKQIGLAHTESGQRDPGSHPRYEPSYQTNRNHNEHRLGMMCSVEEYPLIWVRSCTFLFVVLLQKIPP